MTLKSNQSRLNKYLSFNLGISRRKADDLIETKNVTINDKIAKIGARINSNDKIVVSGKKITAKTKHQYIALNKPVGYVCSCKQQGRYPTIYKLLPNKYYNLKLVGRLDRDSSGLILLTNDGDFSYKMTHPSFYKTKIYNVTLDNDLTHLHQQMISDYGITLKDGPSKLHLEKINGTDRKNWVVVMHEGRNRQIRRTFKSLGYYVNKLHRTNFGNYALGDIKNGEFRIID